MDRERGGGKEGGMVCMCESERERYVRYSRCTKHVASAYIVQQLDKDTYIMYEITQAAPIGCSIRVPGKARLYSIAHALQHASTILYLSLTILVLHTNRLRQTVQYIIMGSIYLPIHTHISFHGQ